MNQREIAERSIEAGRFVLGNARRASGLVINEFAIPALRNAYRGVLLPLGQNIDRRVITPTFNSAERWLGHEVQFSPSRRRLLATGSTLASAGALVGILAFKAGQQYERVRTRKEIAVLDQELRKLRFNAQQIREFEVSGRVPQAGVQVEPITKRPVIPEPAAESISQRPVAPAPERLPTDRMPLNLSLLASESEMRQKGEVIRRAKEILALSPNVNPFSSDPQRALKEREYSERVAKERALMDFLEQAEKRDQATAADVLLALQAMATKPGRAWGMELLWQFRQDRKLEKYGIYPLEQKKIEWARSNDLDPRVLAIATDVAPVVKDMLKAVPELFFEATPAQKRAGLKIDNRVANPGIITALQQSETGWFFAGEPRGFINVGEGEAWDHINLARFNYASGHQDLTFLGQQYQNRTGLPFAENIRKLPGSKGTEGDHSGGAIGAQFMPIWERFFEDLYIKARGRVTQYKLPEPNAWNPWTALILVNLYLSSEFFHRQDGVNNIDLSVIRTGYDVAPDDGVGDFRLAALYKWNPNPPQMIPVLSKGINYFQKFGRD